MIQNKIWGRTRLVKSNSHFECHRAEIKAGFKCSKHIHEAKWNGFMVESGKILIRLWKPDTIDVTELGPGDYTEVGPNQFHRFEALEDSICYELYWSELNPNDIVREDTGGRSIKDPGQT